MFIRIESNDMRVDPKWPAIVLDATHAHWAALRKWFSPALFLKPKIIEDRPRAFEKSFRIQNCQIYDAFPATTRDRSAPHMLNFQLRLNSLDRSSKAVRNLYELRVISPKLRRHGKVRKNVHGPLPHWTEPGRPFRHPSELCVIVSPCDAQAAARPVSAEEVRL